MRVEAGILALAALALVGCGGKVKEVEDAVKLTLIDASSAKFQEIENCSGDRTVWRGKVNAKNRMGAYVGFEPFFYDGISVATPSADADDRFMIMLDRCYSDLKTPEEKAKDAAEAAAKLVNGEWSVREDVNVVDDSKTTYATLTSGEGSNSGGQKVQMTVRCRSKKTEVYLNWDEYLGDDSHDVYNDWKRVTVRVGSETATTERWDISTDGNATFAPSPVALAKSLAKADRFVAETIPYGENPATAVFSLKGAKKALKAVAANCGWTLD